MKSLLLFLTGGGSPGGPGGDPFGGMNVDDIFKQFFGDRAQGFSAPGFETTRPQV